MRLVVYFQVQKIYLSLKVVENLIESESIKMLIEIFCLKEKADYL